MIRAFKEMFGVPDGFRGVEFSGRTDAAIFRDGVENHGVKGEFPTLLERFEEVYAGYLGETLERCRGSLCPGIGPLLDHLVGREDVVLGLSTGNFRRTGRMKLRHYGILHHFSSGGFADDSENRAQIVKAAAERAGVNGNRSAVVIGDTPYDVASAKANGLFALAVATGHYDEKSLGRSGADAVLPDLSDWRAASDLLMAIGQAV